MRQGKRVSCQKLNRFWIMYIFYVCFDYIRLCNAFFCGTMLLQKSFESDHVYFPPLYLLIVELGSIIRQLNIKKER